MIRKLGGGHRQRRARLSLTFMKVEHNMTKEKSRRLAGEKFANPIRDAICSSMNGHAGGIMAAGSNTEA
jgi:hypothetical protein